MHLSTLVIDLVMMLVVAGITTVIFKMIRQPLVLGYIVAGFLIGPNLSALPTVGDIHSIEIWAEIGIICIMFAHGIELNFHKLIRTGSTAIATALTKIIGLSLLGFGAGQMLGWNLTDSIVLGGMLTISSAAIIVKTFEDLNLRGKIFTRVVAGTLIIVETAGVFMMVVMSTYARNESGAELAGTIVQLMVYMALWLILGVFVIPSLLKRAKNFMNDETLLIVSLGVCFGMAYLFSQVELSTALGAFIAGSILAGTIFQEKIENLLKPVKNLFGAVFFISVGMLVDPDILVRYTWPIILISAVIIAGNILFTLPGALLSGQRLDTAIYCGLSLAQIGEFSFIIAALGLSLGLISDFLYPVIVAVSVITTFTTPYLIKSAGKLHSAAKRILPERLHQGKGDETPGRDGEKEGEIYWKWLIRKYVVDTLIKGIIALGILQIGIYFIGPLIGRYVISPVAEMLTTGVVILCMAPFLATLLYQRGKNFSIRSKANRTLLFVFVAARAAITALILLLTVFSFLGASFIWFVIPAMMIILLISRSDWIIGRYLHMETRFLANLHERKNIDSSGPDIIHDPSRGWISERIWVEEYSAEPGCNETGAALKDLKWRRDYHVSVIKTVTNKRHVNIPPAGHKLYAGDAVFLMGTKDKLDMFALAATKKHPWMQKKEEAVTLHDFIVGSGNEHGENRLFCYSVLVEKGSRFEGKNIQASKIGADFSCNIIGIQRDNYHIIYPDMQFVLNSNDEVWLLGGYKMVGRLIMENLIQTEENELIDALDGRR